MISWSSTLRSVAVVATGAFVTFLAVKVMDCPTQRAQRTRSVHGCHKSVSATPTLNPTPLSVDVAEFGQEAFNDAGEIVFNVTDQIPLKAGASFGWRMHLDGLPSMEPSNLNARHQSKGHQSKGHQSKGHQSKGRTVQVKEVFVLPSAPAHWGIGPSTVLSDDLTTATTNDVVKLTDARDGWLSSSWSVSAGDPPGDYKMLVYLDGQLVKTFEFEVKATVKPVLNK